MLDLCESNYLVLVVCVGCVKMKDVVLGIGIVWVDFLIGGFFVVIFDFEEFVV